MNDWEESFGKIAYEAHVAESLKSSRCSVPKWEVLSQPTKDKWTKTAHTTIQAFLKDTGTAPVVVPETSYPQTA